MTSAAAQAISDTGLSESAWISASGGRWFSTSRATGQARRASDLDLAIFAPDANPAEWAELCEALEVMPLIYELDIVRPERLTNERFLGKIARDGIIVYPEHSHS